MFHEYIHEKPADGDDDNYIADLEEQAITGDVDRGDEFGEAEQKKNAEDAQKDTAKYFRQLFQCGTSSNQFW